MGKFSFFDNNGNYIGNENDYQIDKNHFVKTGFQDKYNRHLEDIIVFRVENDGNGNLVFYSKTDNFKTPIPNDVNDLEFNLSQGTSGIVVYDGTNFILQDFDDSIDYQRNQQATRDELDDIQSVSSIQDALDKILYPFQQPEFTSFDINGKSDTYNLGEIFATSGESLTFTWNINHSNNIDSNGFTIEDVSNNNTLATNINKSNTSHTLIINYNISNNQNGDTQVFRITGTDTEGNNIQIDKTFTWRPGVIWGTDPNEGSLNDSQIQSLNGIELSDTKQRTIIIDGNGEYINYTYPQSFGALNRIYVGGVISSAWEEFTINFTNQYGHTESYYLYQTDTIQYGEGIEITFE